MGLGLRLTFEHSMGGCMGVPKMNKCEQGGGEVMFRAFCDNVIIECPLAPKTELD